VSFYQSFKPLAHILRAQAAIVLVAALSGCSVMSYFTSASKPVPAALQLVSGAVSAKQVWSNRIGSINFPMALHVVGGTVYVSGGDGSVAAIDARTGVDQWRTNAGAAVATGVGSDGKTAAVVTQKNDVSLGAKS
jgi:outer membrane protein assembly factor BamB